MKGKNSGRCRPPSYSASGARFEVEICAKEGRARAERVGERRRRGRRSRLRRVRAGLQRPRARQHETAVEQRLEQALEDHGVRHVCHHELVQAQHHAPAAGPVGARHRLRQRLQRVRLALQPAQTRVHVQHEVVEVHLRGAGSWAGEWRDAAGVRHAARDGGRCCCAAVSGGGARPLLSDGGRQRLVEQVHQHRLAAADATCAARRRWIGAARRRGRRRSYGAAVARAP